jgi:hypothetical protein
MTRVQTASRPRRSRTSSASLHGSSRLEHSWQPMIVAAVLSVCPLVEAPLVHAQPPTATERAPFVLLDGVAAVLGGSEPGEPTRTILRSDVELRARLSLLARDSERGLFGELPGSLLAATLDELLGEQLIAAEAERVQIAQPRGSEVAREQQAIVDEAGGRRLVAQLLGRLDTSAPELETMARRRALIGAFLRANLEGATVVTEGQIDERLRTEAARYAGIDMAEARAIARASIAKTALARNIERWVRVLRARTRIRVFAIFEAS